ncbi:unnamed protein product [Meganyctiphanes norvegica]|uniref:Uncharacterized protein n=1 Tax=Meganyctiphanes norvegica TaxID=48144 RepID=A0AAV2QX84_MEGNR
MIFRFVHYSSYLAQLLNFVHSNPRVTFLVSIASCHRTVGRYIEKIAMFFEFIDQPTVWLIINFVSCAAYRPYICCNFGYSRPLIWPIWDKFAISVYFSRNILRGI